MVRKRVILAAKDIQNLEKELKELKSEGKNGKHQDRILEIQVDLVNDVSFVTPSSLYY